MASMVKLLDLKRKKWQSKLPNTTRQVSHRCLANFNRVLNFRMKQEKNVSSPRCSEATLAIVVHPSSSTIPEKQKMGRENPSCSCSLITPVVQTESNAIPDDLVEEILQCLPVYSLVSFKSVSKEWKSLIESSHFAEKHIRLRQKKYGAEERKITVEWSTEGSFQFHTKYFLKLSGMRANVSETGDFLQVAGSCDGLVCVYDSVYVYIFNPSTCVTRTLTPPRGTKLALIHPGGNKLSVGFGRDVVTGRYKVAVLYSCDNDNRVEAKVFDLSTNKWRRRYKTAGPMPLSFTKFTLISLERNTVLAKGSLFWLLARDNDHSEILVMDLHTEKFRTVSLPKDIDVSSGRLYMWSLKDRLCISEFRQRWGSDVWVLEQDEVSERWERTSFDLLCIIPPLKLNSAWFSRSLVSPYQSPSSSR